MKREKINIVWLRATLLFLFIVSLLTLFSTFIGIHFGSKSIARTVQEDLTFFSKMSSNMIESNIARLVTDSNYISNKLNQAYVEGFYHVNNNGEIVHLPPGADALYVAAAIESKIGAQFFHLAAFIPEQNEWVEAVKDSQYEYAILDRSKTAEYKLLARPLDPSNPIDSIVFGIPERTADGRVVLRSYIYRESGLLFVLTISGDTYSTFVDAANLQLYGEGHITLLDESGYIFITNLRNELGNRNHAEKYYDKESDPVFWNYVLQSIENGKRYMDGIDAKKTINFLEFKTKDGGNVFFASAPIAIGNHCISFVITVAANVTPLADIRKIFYVFAAAFSALGFLASLLFGFMQSRPYEQILKLKNMAEDASRVKSDFLSNMSHEIRTPLHAVIGMTEIAQKSSDISHKDHCLNKIRGSSKHLMGVINDILDMSKIEAGMLEIYSQPVLPSEILEKIKDVFCFRCQEKDIDFKINTPDTSQYILSDEQRISQILANLISNAIKFTPKGGSVTLGAQVAEKISEDGSTIVEFSVEDTGIGISEKVQKNLFQAFQQADTSISAKYGGTGLGLAISKRIVGLLGGEIAVNSRPGEGSTFSFTIRAMVCDTPQNGYVPVNTPEKLNYMGKTLLLTEDIELNREIVSSLLEDTGIRIIEAINGEDAVAKFEQLAPEIDIIFMDIQMPGIGGYEATRKIRALGFERAKRVPIIAMTANVFKEDIDKCFAAGMNGHLGKPIDTKAMLLLLNDMLAAELASSQ